MKLITFDAENTVSQRRGYACLSLSRNAANSISKAAAEKMGYGGGDLIAIHQDEENPGDWYISLAEGGFKLRDDKGTGALFFNNTALSNTVLDALEVNEDRVAFFIAGEPTVIEEVQYWAILTSKPIIKKRKRTKS